MTDEIFEIMTYRETGNEIIEKLYTIYGEELNQFIYTFMGDVEKMEDGDFVGIPYPLYPLTNASITFTKEYDKVKITFYWRSVDNTYKSFDYYAASYEDFVGIITDWNKELDNTELTFKEIRYKSDKLYTNRKHYLSKLS